MSYKKFTLYCWFSLLILLVACKGKDKKTDETDITEEDSVELVSPDTTLSAETIQSFNTAGFTDYVKKRAPGFNWNQFTLTTSWEDSLKTTPFTPNPNFFANYGRFLKYSPDSTRFIDLDSYNIFITKDSKGRFIGSESGPDTEISLVDTRTGKKSRLLFLGPGGAVEDAFWDDNQHLVLLGVQESDNNSGKALSVWKYELPTQTWYLYELSDTALANQLAGQWRKERLKGVNIADFRQLFDR